MLEVTMHRTPGRWLVAAVLALGTTACLELDVVNQNAPDINRALAEPADVEQVIASSFIIWYNTINNSTDYHRPLSQLSDELTSTVTTRGYQWSVEPREPFNNDPQGDQVWIPRRSWDTFSECVANTNDGLRQIKKGMIIRTINTGATTVTDNTDRAFAFAKFMQGTCLGYLALTLDKIAAATEDTIIPSGYENQIAWEKEHLKPYSQILAMAIQSLEAAIERATTGAQFTLPPAGWVHQQQYTNQQLIQAAHTLIARFLVLTPRTPEERATVDWQKVLFHTERGLTYDFGPVLESGVNVPSSNGCSNNGCWLTYLSDTGSSGYRMDNHFLGPADQSGRYQAWMAAPREQRNPFRIVTPDRRVTGVADSTNGAYFRFNASLSIFNVARGVENQSFYQWYRRANTGYGGFNSVTGHYRMVTEDENRLLRAEALLRTGNVAGAVDLINVSRTRGLRIGSTNIATNLPPITTDGAPQVADGCVPRKKSGACGDVMDALDWEMRMELTGQDPTRTWADFRGRGLLQPGTIIQYPIPGRYLVSLGLPIYTYGGVGGQGSAR
jgi:hypothetical protein